MERAALIRAHSYRHIRGRSHQPAGGSRGTPSPSLRNVVRLGDEVNLKVVCINSFVWPGLRRGHRIRHYGLLANGGRAENIAKARALLAVLPVAEADGGGTAQNAEPDSPRILPRPCPCCGGRMIVIEVFAPGAMPRYRPPDAAPVWMDTS